MRIILGLALLTCLLACSPMQGQALQGAAEGRMPTAWQVGYQRGRDAKDGFKGVPYAWPDADVIGRGSGPEYDAGYQAAMNGQ